MLTLKEVLLGILGRFYEVADYWEFIPFILTSDKKQGMKIVKSLFDGEEQIGGFFHPPLMMPATRTTWKANGDHG